MRARAPTRTSTLKKWKHTAAMITRKFTSGYAKLWLASKARVQGPWPFRELLVSLLSMESTT